MTDAGINFHFDVDGEDFSSAGAASVEVKKNLRQLGFPPDVIRKVAIAMYEGGIRDRALQMFRLQCRRAFQQLGIIFVPLGLEPVWVCQI